jgi:hypothetical protein
VARSSRPDQARVACYISAQRNAARRRWNCRKLGLGHVSAWQSLIERFGWKLARIDLYRWVREENRQDLKTAAG